MTLLEPASPPLPRPSAPARPETTYQWERFALIAREVAPLVRQHWREVALFQDSLTLEPDWDRVIKLDFAEVLHILTVRVDGALVGFCFNYLIPSILYRGHVWATTEGFWLDPIWRAGLIGYRMFRENEKGLRERGCAGHTVEIMSHIAAERGTVGKLLMRLGYQIAGHTYGKVFQDGGAPQG